MDRVRQRLADPPQRLCESNNHNEIDVQTEFSRLQQRLQMQSPSFRGSLVTGQTKNRNSVNECLFVWLVGCFQNCAGSFTSFLAKSNLDYLTKERVCKHPLSLHCTFLLVRMDQILDLAKSKEPKCLCYLSDRFIWFFVFQLSSLASTCLWASD